MDKLKASMLRWGLTHEEEIKALEEAEAQRLARWFCHMVAGFVEEGEAEERALLADLLEGVDLEEV